MDKQQKLIAGLLSVALVLALIVIAIVTLRTPTPEPEFTPPPFEAAAIYGSPEVSDESLGYHIFSIPSGYTVGMCAKVTVNEGAASLYFTSPSSNTVWLRLKLYDEQGTLLGESGLLKPGEYVESIAITSCPATDGTLKAKVYSYEPDTYYSHGTADFLLALSVE